MSKTIQTIIKAGLGAHLLKDSDIKRLFKGTPASRYGLINKALAKKELIALKRGVYILNTQYMLYKPPSLTNPFYIACHMVPHSYISLESALSYHGLIPERVTVVTAVIHHGKTKSFLTPLGKFDYRFIPVQPYEFLTGVRREYDLESFFVRTSSSQYPYLIASPLRALADLVYEKKYHWESLHFLTESLRIDIDHLLKIESSEFTAIKQVYSSKRVLLFLTKLEEALEYVKSLNYSR